jgi:hypothetical protein
VTLFVQVENILQRQLLYIDIDEIPTHNTENSPSSSLPPPSMGSPLLPLDQGNELLHAVFFMKVKKEFSYHRPARV